jgi:hypothetical protein
MSEAATVSHASLAAWQRKVHEFSWRVLGCHPAYAGSLLVAQLWLGLLWIFYQGFGVARGFILCCLLAGLIVLRFFPRTGSSRQPAGAAALPLPLKFLLLATIVLDLGMMTVSSTVSFETSIIPMDEGVTSWRAASLLWRGENPYGGGALVDLNAFRSRAPQRAAAGIRTVLLQPAQRMALRRYDATLDPQIRNQLLPLPRAAAPVEARLYGYKYGPVILAATAAVVPFGEPGAVMILNGLVSFCLLAVMWPILRRVSAPQIGLAGVAMLALLLDRHITRNYIDRSATDVWALLFGSLAVLASLSRRPIAAAIAVAFAIGCKSVPGLLFVPLLFRTRSTKPVLVFLAVAAAIYAPWLIRDPPGLVSNVFLWPLYMAKDGTSWEFFAPGWFTLAVRGAAVCVLAVLWLRYLAGKEQRLFWTLAVSNTVVLLASGYLRNGYIPWISLWMVTAIAEAFAIQTATGGEPARKPEFARSHPFNRRTAAAG